MESYDLVEKHGESFNIIQANGLLQNGIKLIRNLKSN